jgi:aryl-alcohol dehydrogenase-like predicted oxidoreductase
MSLAGRATPEGTRRYRDRMVEQGIAPLHYREAAGLALSSIGLGTYLGKTDDESDERYVEAIAEAVRNGCNVLDTAINYRHQRSERCIGIALEQLDEEGTAQRDEIFVSTKGGYIPFDGSMPPDPVAYFRETFIEPGVLSAKDVVGGMHSIAPGYLKDQLTRSLANMGLETVDLYYVHNPEGQLPEIGRPKFRLRLREAFRYLEKAATDGQIGMYGAATWNGLRVASDAPEFLSLREVRELASQAADGDAAFGCIQLPYNLTLTEALMLGNQIEPGDRRISTLLAARDARLPVMASCSLMQGRLGSGLPPEVGEALNGLDSDAQRALQFVRSSPGVTVALVGMSRKEHVLENMAVARLAPASPEQFRRLFQPAQ